MSTHEQVIRQLEDFILAEHELYPASRLPFEHAGKVEYGYPYIRFGNAAFETALVACLEVMRQPSRTVRFLEVGCGLGTKCEIARLHGMQASGLDLNPEYVALADRIYFNCTFLHANALEFDYREFDLVYYHVPFFEDSLLFDLERQILSQLPIQGVLFVTRVSASLQQALQEKAALKSSLGKVHCGSELDVRRIQAFQKTASIETSQFE